MFYVYYMLNDVEMIAVCKSESAAMDRAYEEFDRGCDEVEVYDSYGNFVFEATEALLVEEN